MCNQDASLAGYFCPVCHQATFREHWMAEFRREWNKCPSCGYMETKITTKNRILSVLNPSALIEPFEDPLTEEIINRATRIGIYGNRIQKDNTQENDDRKS